MKFSRDERRVLRRGFRVPLALHRGVPRILLKSEKMSRLNRDSVRQSPLRKKIRGRFGRPGRTRTAGAAPGLWPHFSGNFSEAKIAVDLTGLPAPGAGLFRVQGRG
jgi:hypothetical protein